MTQPIRYSKMLQIIFAGDSTCVYCGSFTKNPTIDHIVPRANGGSNDLTNLVVACNDCNMSKRDSKLELWLTRMGLDHRKVYNRLHDAIVANIETDRRVMQDMVRMYGGYQQAKKQVIEFDRKEVLTS